MKKWKKVTLIAGGALALVIIVWVSVYQANKDLVTVQTGKVARQNLTAIVTASGEIRPKNYTNVLGEGFGKITEIAVKEGDWVKRGDVLLRIENIQPTADVNAQQAAQASAEAAQNSAEANYGSMEATIAQRQADLDKAKFDWERGQQLYQEKLIAKQEYDARKAAYDSAVAALAVSRSQLQQARAQRAQAGANLNQSQAVLRRMRDVLRKTTYTAPIDGMVSYIAVRVGENVVPGIQNAEGSYLMTISDMSIVTGEVKVDETDIINVKNGQQADVLIDAVPGKTFKGHVTQVGTQAVLRTSGLATTQTTANTEEAKDFKVVVTMDNPPANLRPGLSVTAKIDTAHKDNILTIPLQALVVRSRKDLEEAKKEAAKKGGGETVTLAAAKPASTLDPSKDEIQGVFVVNGKKAVFVPVQTGITGVSDIEVTNGLQEGAEVITGSYKILRSLRPGAPVKVDNTPTKREETEKT